ncbi:uncharacterized protein PITG_17974 [Phytophthora infestans T30-4]|uniref:Uncharacterized protein n=1 Tax=Phytophthora infestans (strain T30-4) TaxID=403677 RepID=D0NXE3_PHYIT|nr:uncharacterized protein PITG_17974 [Phytophthora infestans T30-4]EEY67743.1 hypothetical protein PITG_17974 [Phytophthora infestans T30-4]|eukprot:XP_002997905.1 hypothetical protein PITG_17974 [Phytophthora infestans T30-4]
MAAAEEGIGDEVRLGVNMDPNGLAKLAPPRLCQKMNNQATPPDDDLESVAQIMALIAAYHGSPYYWKEACHISALTGPAWVAELDEGTHTESLEAIV